MAEDAFSTYADGMTSPPRHAADITPADESDLANVARAIHVGVGGDVKVDTQSGETVTFKNLASGARLVGFFQRVYSTGTSATDLVAQW